MMKDAQFVVQNKKSAMEWIMTVMETLMKDVPFAFLSYVMDETTTVMNRLMKAVRFVYLKMRFVMEWIIIAMGRQMKAV